MLIFLPDKGGNKNMANKYLLRIIVVLTITALNYTPQVRGNTLNHEETQDILTIISAQTRENQEKVQTWVGMASMKEKVVYRGKALETLSKLSDIFRNINSNLSAEDAIERTANGLISFAVDISQDKVYSNLQVFDAEMTNAATGQKYNNSFAKFAQASIITPEAYMHFQPNMLYGRSQVPLTDGARKHAAFIDPVGKIPGRLFSDVVDPRYFGYVSGEPVWKMTERMADWLAKGENDIEGQNISISMAEMPDGLYKLTYSGSNKGGETATGEYVFDKKVGLNIVSNTFKWGEKQWIRLQNTWEYKEVDGIYIPNKVMHLQYDKHGNLKFSRVFSIKDSKINVPVGNHTFTFENLGVEDGDRVIDNIKKIEYTYNNGELIPAIGKLMLEKANAGVMENMIKDVAESLANADSNSEIFIPKETVGLKKTKPFILDLESRTFLYVPNKVESEQTYNRLIKLKKGDLAWDDKLVAARNATILTVPFESHRPLKQIDNKWSTSYKLPSKIQLPYTLLSTNKEGTYYLITIRKIESDGIWIVYQKLNTEELKRYKR